MRRGDDVGTGGEADGEEEEGEGQWLGGAGVRSGGDFIRWQKWVVIGELEEQRWKGGGGKAAFGSPLSPIRRGFRLREKSR